MPVTVLRPAGQVALTVEFNEQCYERNEENNGSKPIGIEQVNTP
jgi:hypothetical protein